MVGGGVGSFIGAVHRMAANLDGLIELACGAFSSNPETSLESGKELFLAPDRIYGSFREMIERESQLPEGQKMDFVSIVTPNHVHFEPAFMALKHGFPVIIDKPLSFNLDEALQLRQAVEESKLPFALTHTYTGYPMVKQARAMVASGEIGDLRKIMVEYPQGWLTDFLEGQDQKQAAWRTDPKRSGKSGCFGDIGTHAGNMAEYVSGLRIEKVLADLKIFVKGRALDDDANILLQFEGGVTGALYASQVAAGEENNVKVRVYGTKGGVEWAHRDPNTLWVKNHGMPDQIYRSGAENSYLSPLALKHCRTPSGHPEGYLEAFANIYRNFAFAVKEQLLGIKGYDKEMDFPGIEDGVRGMALIDAVVSSSENGNVWTAIEA